MGVRPEKEAMVKEVREHLESSEYAILTDCRGMDVAGMGELRGQLRGANSKLLVVKNAFVGRASSELGWERFESLLTGPTALVTGTGDISEVARLLKDFAKKTQKPAVKGGRFGERTLSAADMETIASIPPREVLLAQFVGTLAAPMTRLVGAMNQKLLSLVYVLKAAAEKKA